MTLLGALLVWLLAATLLVLWRHGTTLKALWSEPMLRHPVLIFESDDWGPDATTHAQCLQRLADTLNRYKDAQGRPAVMTLGMILAIPDRQRMREQGGGYAVSSLADPRYAALREVIEQGVARGVFSLQLHGKEHYWPPSLMKVAKADEAVAAWLYGEHPRTEALPAYLQSRWIDASTLPTRALEDDDIEAAAEEEIALFAHIFGQPPTVVVPPTFVWTAAVERAWAKGGVRVLVTPGRRFEGRDERGGVIAGDVMHRNGMRGPDRLMYIVRDDYFEPARGHRAEQAWAALQLKTQCGRPTLLETHRYNYADHAAVAERSYTELARALEGALRIYPNLRFLSTECLTTVLMDGKEDWIESRRGARFQTWCRRLRQEPRAWRLVRYTGLGWVFWLLQRAAGPTKNENGRCIS